MGEAYPFLKLTQEMVVALRGDEKAHEAAGEIARKSIVAGVLGTRAAGSDQSPRESVRQVCQGALTGLFLIEGRVPDGAVAILRQMAHAAHDVHLDPMDLMTWSMEGLAAACAVVPPAVVDKVQSEIEESFHGAGEVFAALRVGRAP